MCGSKFPRGLDRPGFCGGLVMPWRVPRRGWWCGCDGSGVRRRRVTGRRGWRGGVGCGCTSSPTGRWRSRGRRGPSRGRRARTGPALVGLVEGLGGGVVVGGAHGSGRCLDALVDESSGVGDGQVLRSVVAVVDQAGQASAFAVLALPDRLFQDDPGRPATTTGAPIGRTGDLNQDRDWADPEPPEITWS